GQVGDRSEVSGAALQHPAAHERAGAAPHSVLLAAGERGLEALLADRAGPAEREARRLFVGPGLAGPEERREPPRVRLAAAEPAGLPLCRILQLEAAEPGLLSAGQLIGEALSFGGRLGCGHRVGPFPEVPAEPAPAPRAGSLAGQL